MPSAYVMSLRPDGALPSWAVFPKLHGLACTVLEPGIQAPEPDGLGRHDGGHYAQAKPFAVWPLLRDTTTAELNRLEWRLNWLRDPPEPAGASPASPWRPGPERLRLGATTMRRLGVRELTQPYAHLARKPPRQRYDFTFLSPTYFARSERDYLLPDPELLFGRLAQRWNQHVGDQRLRLDDELIGRLRAKAILIAHDIATVRTGEHLATVLLRRTPLVVDYELTRERVPHDPAERAGFVGVATFGLHRPDSAVVQAFAALCAFAEYAGIGAQTTHGLGAVTTMPDRG